MDSLAIHPIGHPPMSRDAISEILDIERPLEAARKEPSKRRHERGKRGHDQRVDLERRVRDRRDLSAHDRLGGGLDERGPFERGPEEDGVGSAVNVGPSAHAEVLGWAGHVRESHEERSPLASRGARISSSA